MLIDANTIGHNCSTGDVKVVTHDILKICVNGFWTSITRDSDFMREWMMGNVACRQLGYGDQG